MADKRTVALRLLFACIRMHICRRRVAVILYGEVQRGRLRGQLAGFGGGQGASGARIPWMWLALAPLAF